MIIYLWKERDPKKRMASKGLALARIVMSFYGRGRATSVDEELARCY